MKKVLLGMSGGVDSTVAAIILKEQGYEVVGITFKFTDNFDVNDAIIVSKYLNIEHHILDYKKIFKEKVIDKFITDYNSGLTPNPCILCNREVKFKFLYDNMIKYNCDYIATGHYARIIDGKLYKSSDINKDQTYFLSQLTKEQISKLLLPLEDINKDKVREIANKYNLKNANKKDSYDICFITDKFKDFISKTNKSTTGDIIDVKTCKIIGKHNGLNNYTIGQRKGLNIGGTTDRLYVVGKDINKNILYVSLGEDSEYLISNSCILKNVNLLNEEKFTNVKAKFRYRQIETDVELIYLDNNKIKVKYESIKAVTPGQICAFYKDDECLGSGIIENVEKNNKKLWYL